MDEDSDYCDEVSFPIPKKRVNTSGRPPGSVTGKRRTCDEDLGMFDPDGNKLDLRNKEDRPIVSPPSPPQLLRKVELDKKRKIDNTPVREKEIDQYSLE